MGDPLTTDKLMVYSVPGIIKLESGKHERVTGKLENMSTSAETVGSTPSKGFVAIPDSTTEVNGLGERETEFLWKEVEALSSIVQPDSTTNFTSIKSFPTPDDDTYLDNLDLLWLDTLSEDNLFSLFREDSSPFGLDCSDSHLSVYFEDLESMSPQNTPSPGLAYFVDGGVVHYPSETDSIQERSRRYNLFNNTDNPHDTNQTVLNIKSMSTEQYQESTCRRSTNNPDDTPEFPVNTQIIPHKAGRRRSVGEPRRPKNGFIRYSIACRQQIAVERPRLDNREISRVLGARWRKMSAEERKPYEVEFEKDITEIREHNPEWRYAPAKKLAAELVEPMPSRLRPRENMKRHIPPLVRSYKRRQPKESKSKIYSEPIEVYPATWVQCELCFKWRRLPSDCNTTDIMSDWSCPQNPDVVYNACWIPEEWTDTTEVISVPCTQLQFTT